MKSDTSEVVNVQPRQECRVFLHPSMAPPAASPSNRDPLTQKPSIRNGQSGVRQLRVRQHSRRNRLIQRFVVVVVNRVV